MAAPPTATASGPAVLRAGPRGVGGGRGAPGPRKLAYLLLDSLVDLLLGSVRSEGIQNIGLENCIGMGWSVMREPKVF
jgi:hypothetical protein